MCFLRDKKNASFILSLDFSFSWAFVKAAVPIWKLPNPLLELSTYITELVMTPPYREQTMNFGFCKYLSSLYRSALPPLFWKHLSVLETEDMIYFYRHSCQTGQQPQFSAFRCSTRQGNQSEAPFMSVPPPSSVLLSYFHGYLLCYLITQQPCKTLQLDPSTERGDLLRPPCSLLLLPFLQSKLPPPLLFYNSFLSACLTSLFLLFF